MPQEDATALELVTRARQGDLEARDELWDMHRRWVAAIVLAHRPRAAEVEDLMQDVAERLIGRLDTLRDPEAFRPWLRQIVLNVCRGWARRDRPMLSIDAPLPGGSADQPAERFLSAVGQPTGDQVVAQEDAAERLLKQVDGLPPEYREPLLLRCLRSMTYQQISELLDLPVTTIETRLARARRMLRVELGASMGFPDHDASDAADLSPAESAGDRQPRHPG